MLALCACYATLFMAPHCYCHADIRARWLLRYYAAMLASSGALRLICYAASFTLPLLIAAFAAIHMLAAAILFKMPPRLLPRFRR